MASTTTTDTIDAAWAAANEALPEGWRVGELKNVEYRGPGERWLVMAWSGDEYRTFEAEYGDTPIEALRALAQKVSR